MKHDGGLDYNWLDMSEMYESMLNLHSESYEFSVTMIASTLISLQGDAELIAHRWARGRDSLSHYSRELHPVQEAFLEWACSYFNFLRSRHGYSAGNQGAYYLDIYGFGLYFNRVVFDISLHAEGKYNWSTASEFQILHLAR